VGVEEQPEGDQFLGPGHGQLFLEVLVLQQEKRRQSAAPSLWCPDLPGLTHPAIQVMLLKLEGRGKLK
jgi:hypothetical protein